MCLISVIKSGDQNSSELLLLFNFGPQKFGKFNTEMNHFRGQFESIGICHILSVDFVQGTIADDDQRNDGLKVPD